MANTIQVKRGVFASVPTLSAGEFGFCTDTFQLFVGTAASGNKEVLMVGGTPAAHTMASTGPHADTGLTVGHVVRASGAAAFAWAELQHADLGGVTADLHHAQVHILPSTGAHAEAGLTTGHAMVVSGAEAFGWAYLDELASTVTMQASGKFIFDTADEFYFTADTFNWDIVTNMMSLSGTALSLLTTNGLSLLSTNRRVTFDANDYLQFDSNTFKFFIGSVEYFELSDTTAQLHVTTQWSKTGTATVGVPYPSRITGWQGSGWDTGAVAAVSLTISNKLVAGEGGTGAVPYSLCWYKTDQATVLMEMDGLAGTLEVMGNPVLDDTSTIDGGAF